MNKNLCSKKKTGSNYLNQSFFLSGFAVGGRSAPVSQPYFPVLFIT